jgi:S-adenosylmethionine:diacylglycerol 3-amino-3-carboxypropyl transferase
MSETAFDRDTAWERGRFDNRLDSKQLLFGRMYEDPAIERGAFRPGGRVLCVASAGCTAIALSGTYEVVAVDLNPEQIAYAKSRAAGGAASPGIAERTLARGRALAPLVGWRSSRVLEFLDLESPDAQREFWRRHLDTARFRVAIEVLLSRFVLRTIYARALLHCLPRDFGAVMRERLRRGFAHHPNRRNPYARALLLGELPDGAPPPQAGRIRFVHDDVAGFLERQPPAGFDGFSLSNILDGAGDDYRRRLTAAVRRAAAPGAVAVLRSFSEPRTAPPSNLAGEDRSMLWGTVEARPAAWL